MSAFGGIADIAQTSGIRCRRSPDRTPALQRAADRSSPIRYAVIDTLGRQRIQFDQLQRREFVTLLCGVAAAWPLKVRAQQAGRVRRIGVLKGFSESDPAVQSWLTLFRGALAKLGWTEGSNLRIELRSAGDDPDRTQTFAKELVDLRPDAILSVTTPVTGALIRETQTIPIVIVTVADPISSGFVTSLGHPGGNVTGFALYEPGMGGKWLELLKQIAPGVKRVALLFNPATTVPVKFYMSSIEAAASSFPVQTSTAPVHAQDEIEGVIAALAGNAGAGLIVMPDLFNVINRDLIIAPAARYRVPAIYFFRSFADSGGLISYGPDFAEQYPRAAGYIDRILKGEKPADLPIQMPIKVPLVINLKTANALGLDVPLHLQQLADEVIE